VKLRADQLPGHLEGSLAPIYLVSGDEPLLVQESCDAIRAAARAQGFSDRTVFEVDGSFDWNALHQVAGNLSLFAVRRLIELRFSAARIGDGSEPLREYAAQPPDDTLLLIVFPRLDSQLQKSKWYTAIERAGAVLHLWPPDQAQLPGWVARRMSMRGLRPGKGAAELLAERSEGNLLACVQEIEKILLLRGPGSIEAEEVLQAVADSARYDIFDLSDAALAGDVPRCLRVMRGLREEGVEPPLVLWALTRTIRDHAGFAARREAGENLEQSLRFDRVWSRRQGLIERALRRHGRRAWWELLRRAAHIDRVAKGQAPGNAWDDLLQLTLIIAGAFPVTAIREEESGYR
jgi:DNA polymerase-3 subunit delta